ncbi:protein trichome birefringence-like 4 [Neltuma alba]|uniref:protein trichome birefringence-like 4 n=1 Tax=Neltuma alba TaxID=207710 RepID=UPI0010A53FD1|nr:protein trichome birefringence-like 4 [Prosopis alba]XP_028788786.1 protein trichome birefringence-like 4 [Prosopis alba]
MACFKSQFFTLKGFLPRTQHPLCRPRTHILTVFLLLLLYLLSRSYSYDYSPSSSAASAVTVAASRFLLSSDAFSSVTAAEISRDPPLSSTAHESQIIRDLASCDIFDGAWVLDRHARPPYPPGSCPFLDDAFNCFKNRRPDSDYLEYRWKPRGCHIPRFDGLKMLRLLRGKRMVFVGDSLNRNMWQSLVCSLRESLKDKTRVFLVSARRELRTQGFHSYRFKDYGCSIDFIKSPFLVQEWKNNSSYFDEGPPHGETLRLDMMQASKSQYNDADIIIFNTGHWWNHHKTRNGRNYFREGNHVYDRLDVKEALGKALRTWAKWVDSKVDSTRTRVFFTGFSASHYRGGQWKSGGKCDGEREPIKNESHVGEYPWTMRILESVMADMKTPVFYLNISRMTEYRKDGHPSLYRGPSPPPRTMVQDCSHWCLPGIPDSWNHLLYSTLLLHHHHDASSN